MHHVFHVAETKYGVKQSTATARREIRFPIPLNQNKPPFHWGGLFALPLFVPDAAEFAGAGFAGIVVGIVAGIV